MSQIEPVLCRKKYKQNNPCYLQEFQAAIRYLAIIKSQLNEYINKLPYFNSFCQPFYIPFFYNIFDQHLFCCYEKLFSQPVHNKVIKMKKWLALTLPLTSLFSNAQQNFCPVKRNFFPTLTYSWVTIKPVYIFRRLKRMIKSEEIVGLNVHIRFKIELIYSIWNR